MTPEKSLYKIDYGSEFWYVIAESLLDAVDIWDLHFGATRSDAFDERVGITAVHLGLCQDSLGKVFN
jgi:hypothetical protein